MDADYADYIELIPALAESRLHSLYRTAGSIGHHVNVNKAEYMFFNSKGDIFILKDGSLKLVDKFT